MVYAKLFMPDGDWYLYVGEYCARTREVFCYAILNGDLQSAEWGWQYVDDLKAVRGRMGLPMERDTSFQPRPLSEAIAGYRRSRGLDDDSSPLAAEPEPALSPITATGAQISGATAEQPGPNLDAPAPVRLFKPAPAADGSGWTLPMKYLGVASAHGDAFVFGYALDTGDKKPLPVYLNLGLRCSRTGIRF